jgi:hypothetical protein
VILDSPIIRQPFKPSSGLDSHRAPDRGATFRTEGCFVTKLVATLPAVDQGNPRLSLNLRIKVTWMLKKR